MYFCIGAGCTGTFPYQMCSDWTKKTAEKLREYGICADFMPEHSNSTNLAQELKEYLDQEFRGDPFKRAVIWYPTAKNAKDNLVDTLLSFCDCGRLNVYENVPCPIEVPVYKDVYDAIFLPVRLRRSGCLAV